MRNQISIILNPQEFEAFKLGIETFNFFISYSHAIYDYEYQWWDVYLCYTKRFGNSLYYPNEFTAPFIVGKLIGKTAQRFPKRFNQNI